MLDFQQNGENAMSDPAKLSPLLKHCPLFAHLSDRDLSVLLARLSPREQRFRQGEFLLRQGDAVPSLGLILSGSAHILREDFWGNRNLIAVVSPGQLFGEAYACAGAPAGVGVQAAADTAAWFLDVRTLLSLQPDTAPFAAPLLGNLLTITARKNLLLNDHLAHVTQRTTREKLLSYLSRESVRQHSADFYIPFDRQQLADYLAVDRSALSTELGRLRDVGRLTFHKNHFVLLHPEPSL